MGSVRHWEARRVLFGVIGEYAAGKEFVSTWLPKSVLSKQNPGNQTQFNKHQYKDCDICFRCLRDAVCSCRR
jgi:hypothetical protein